MTTELPDTEKKVSKGILKAADRYLARLRGGEFIMRTSRGEIQWADGRPLGLKTIEYMLAEHMIAPLDTDLFGDRSRGQTIGLVQ